jgi:hypothetical protein
MKQKILLIIVCLFCFSSLCIAGDNKPIPIPMRPKGSPIGTHSPVVGDPQFTLSASYTADTLTVEFTDYTGIVVVSIIDEVTGTAVSQTIGHITATANTVQTDISTLPDGNYTLSIVPQTGDEYEGEFTIQRE